MLHLKSCLACILLMLCLLCGMQTSFAQTITGKVYRAGTDSAIVSASVYYGGSMAGTITDKNGNFELPAKAQQIPLTVSCIGYYSSTLNYQPGNPLIVYLKPKIEELHTVTIRADGMSRKDEVAMFLRDFLGTSEYAKSCTITNIDDVNLFYNKKTKTLTASCDKPLNVENKKLGYLITYYLDTFNDSNDDFLLKGNHIFKDMELSGADLVKVKRNREDAYQGSRMQFVRGLWHRTLAQAGFRIYNVFTPIKEDSVLVIDSLQQKYISYRKKFYISYFNRPVSFITVLQNKTFIDKNGFYDASLEWGGSIGIQRVGDLLPYEYRSEPEEKAWAKLLPEPVKVQPTITPPTIAEKPANNNPLLFEKTYLFTDRDVYSKGDTLWFKAYLVNAHDNRLTGSSNNLRVELISPDAKIIITELIRMDDGLGNGDISLADTLPAGKYRLRAYTNWMRNFGNNLVFEKEITLLSKAVALMPAIAAGTKTRPNPKKNPALTINNTVAIRPPTVRFFPEGGSMVNGISSIMGVKAEDGSGKGIAVSGVVISSAGDTITHFKCDSVGMGLLAIIPQSGQRYRAEVKSRSYALPDALNNGLAIQVKPADSLLRVIIGSAINPTALAIKPVYRIAVKHEGVTIVYQQIHSTGQQTQVTIPTAYLPEGINAIVVYDETNKPNCERLVYIHHSNNPVVSIRTDKLSYQSKEQVNVQIDVKETANLSMAVVDADIVPEQEEDLRSYLMLESEIMGTIEHPHRYFDTTNVNRFKQLDLLLMTQGWRDFVWRRLADTAIRISYAAENGIPVTGLVKDEVDNEVMPNLNVTLFADAAKGDKTYTASTNPAGRFGFTGLQLYGTQNVKLASVNDKGQKKGSLYLDTIKPMPVSPQVNKAASSAADDSLTAIAIAKRETMMKNSTLKGVTQLKEVTIKEKSNNITRLESGLGVTSWGPHPDQVFAITAADMEYRTLLWFLTQKVIGTRLSPGNDLLVMPAIKRPNNLVFFVNGKELMLWSDRQVQNMYRNNYFLMPLNKFKKIEVKTVIGPGLVDYCLLYLDMIDDFETDNPGSLSADVSGYYQARSFYEPAPDAKPSVADYRTTIHWQPNITTDVNGKTNVSFYNAVPATHVKVLVQGVTLSGRPIAETAIYEMK